MVARKRLGLQEVPLENVLTNELKFNQILVSQSTRLPAMYRECTPLVNAVNDVIRNFAPRSSSKAKLFNLECPSSSTSKPPSAKYEMRVEMEEVVARVERKMDCILRGIKAWHLSDFIKAGIYQISSRLN